MQANIAATDPGWLQRLTAQGVTGVEVVASHDPRTAPGDQCPVDPKGERNLEPAIRLLLVLHGDATQTLYVRRGCRELKRCTRIWVLTSR